MTLAMMMATKIKHVGAGAAVVVVGHHPKRRRKRRRQRDKKKRRKTMPGRMASRADAGDDVVVGENNSVYN